MLMLIGFFTEISKYILLVDLTLFTLLGFIMLFFKSENNRQLCSIFQWILIFLYQAISFLHLSIINSNKDYIFLYLFSQIIIIAILGLFHMVYEKENSLLLNNMTMLLGLGFVIISRLDFAKAIRQAMIVTLSFGICLFIPMILRRLHIWKKMTWGYAFLGVGALSMVLVLGEVYGGSKISFTIADTITFQPSEFVKLLFLFFLAAALAEDNSFFHIAASAIVAGLHVIILVISTDLGSALIFFIVYVLVVFVSTQNYLYLLLGTLGGSSAAFIAYQIFDHVKIRVIAWKDPWTYIDNSGYQITQSLFAIGTGNWFGLGLCKGNPKAIPLVDRDFIFSSICEELGVITGICIICICVGSFLVMCQISTLIKDHFYQLIVFGAAIGYIFQVFLTIGGGIKFIPMTGVTLPFISYGGSSAMTSMILFSIVQGVYLMMQEKGGKPNARQAKANTEQKHKQKSSR